MIIQVKLDGIGRYMGWDFKRKKSFFIAKKRTILLKDGNLEITNS